MAADDDPSIADLVAAAAAGDGDAWNALVDRYTPLLIAVIARTGLSGAPLEDVAQTVWLRLIEHLGDLREPRALPMWIITTARREALRLAMSDRRTAPEDPQGPGLASLPADTPEPDTGLLLSERQEALLAGLATLSPRQRELLTLLIEDPPVPYVEISRRTGIPIGSIGPTRSRALDRLRQVPALTALITTGDGNDIDGRQAP